MCTTNYGWRFDNVIRFQITRVLVKGAAKTIVASAKNLAKYAIATASVLLARTSNDVNQDLFRRADSQRAEPILKRERWELRMKSGALCSSVTRREAYFIYFVAFLSKHLQVFST